MEVENRKGILNLNIGASFADPVNSQPRQQVP